MKPVWAPYEENIVSHNCFKTKGAALSDNDLSNTKIALEANHYQKCSCIFICKVRILII